MLMNENCDKNYVDDNLHYHNNEDDDMSCSNLSSPK